MLAFDLHLDLAMNALWYDRDLKLRLDEAREAERGMTGVGRSGGVGPPEKAVGKGTVTLPEMRRGHVGLCVATVLARVRRGEGGYGTGYRTHEITYGVAQGMLAYYRELERQGEMRMVRTGPEMGAAAREWDAALAAGRESEAPIAFVLGTEGADCVVEPAQLGRWWEDGLRAVSLVHYGVSKYAHGTGTDGPLTDDGRALLRAMDEVGAILDITHQSDTSFWESLERFKGPVFASHQNCRALVPGGRQFSDDQLKALFERGAIVGPALDNWMLYPGYVRMETPRELIHLADYVEHVDHICQLAGNARHVAIGSDLDGGYGFEQTPEDLLSIADLQKVPAMLRGKGYSDADVSAFMSGNAVRFFEKALPAA